MSHQPTSTEIVNIALRRVGADPLTDLIADVSTTASTARDLYDHVRAVVLKRGKFHFARIRASIGKLATGPAWGFANAFQLPADALYVVAMKDGDSFSVENKQLLTDAGAADILYVSDITDLTVWTADALDAFAWRLAAEFAIALLHSKELYERYMGIAATEIRNAAGEDDMESSSDVETGEMMDVSPTTLTEIR